MDKLTNQQNLSVEQTLNFYSSKTYDKYKEFLDNSLKFQKNSSIFHFLHIENFINLHQNNLSTEKYFYKEKLFNLALELKLLDKAERIIKELKKEYGNETKIIRMEANLNEINNQYDFSLETFIKLIRKNQDDRLSLKHYLGMLKIKYNLSNIKDYTEILNEYLKIYMDDMEIWYELSDIYLLTNNYNKAIYCLEEALLHYPNNYQIYTKIGDVHSSFNNTDSAMNAIKYYSQSVLIHPSLKAFWGLFYAINIVLKYNKSLDEKLTSLHKIAKVSIMEIYSLTDKDLKKQIEEILAA